MSENDRGPSYEDDDDARQLPLDGELLDAPTLDALVEAMLLVAPHPADPAELAAAAGVDEPRIEVSLARLGAADDRGWVLVRHGGTVSLATAPRFAPHIRRFLGMERESRLSGASLETLAIVAYRQPVSRAEIEAVRGVDCTGVLATLHARGLVETIGRGAGVGSPNLFGTTAAFLHHFGLRSLAELPPIGEVNGHDSAALLDAAIAAAPSDDEALDGNDPG